MKWLDAILRGGRATEGPPRGDPERVRAAQAVIDRLAPLVAADGGDVRLVGVDGDWVVVRWSGACTSCSARPATLSGALEPELRAALPWLAGVRSE